LIAQLSHRRIKWSNDGKLWLESKEDIRKRGEHSPDYADAFCMAHCVLPFVARSLGESGARGLFDPDSFAGPFRDVGVGGSIGVSHNLGSNDDDDESYADRRTWNSPGRGDGGGSGFGGVHCEQ
jgi:hypothetical protein